jgi:hypothetical protein
MIVIDRRGQRIGRALFQLCPPAPNAVRRATDDVAGLGPLSKAA